MAKILLLTLALSVVCAFAHNNHNEGNIPEENQKAVKQWALLVAGSDGWWNYRHQADIAHAYKILVGRGISKDNIIVMMKDDIAYNDNNPTPGVLINKPDGPDVYKGIKIDYKGDDVTPKNFLNILSGNKNALKGIGTGRVIESTSKDNVFVNFADHGGTGILCFPDDDLNAKDLINTVKKLNKDKKYAKLVFYIEACEAGSNFDNLLPTNTKILVSTASATDESSWGYYCDYQNYPCLGDLYSINWMEHLDQKLPNKENLFDQYQVIRTATALSHVQLYGDFLIGSSSSNQFLGPNDLSPAELDADDEDSENKGIPVASRDIALHWIKKMAEHGKNSLHKLKYGQMAQDIEKKRGIVDDVVKQLIEKVVDGDKDLMNIVENKHQPLNMEMLDCYINIYKRFSQQCFNLNKNPYVLKHFYKFANLCHMEIDYEEQMTSTIDKVCDNNFPQITQTL